MAWWKGEGKGKWRKAKEAHLLKMNLSWEVKDRVLQARRASVPLPRRAGRAPKRMERMEGRRGGMDEEGTDRGQRAASHDQTKRVSKTLFTQ